MKAKYKNNVVKRNHVRNIKHKLSYVDDCKNHISKMPSLLILISYPKYLLDPTIDTCYLKCNLFKMFNFSFPKTGFSSRFFHITKWNYNPFICSMQMEIILDIPYFPFTSTVSQSTNSFQDLCLDFLISIFFPLSKLLAILCELVFLIYCYYSPYTIILFVLLSVFLWVKY